MDEASIVGSIFKDKVYKKKYRYDGTDNAINFKSCFGGILANSFALPVDTNIKQSTTEAIPNIKN